MEPENRREEPQLLPNAMKDEFGGRLPTPRLRAVESRVLLVSRFPLRRFDEPFIEIRSSYVENSNVLLRSRLKIAENDWNFAVETPVKIGQR